MAEIEPANVTALRPKTKDTTASLRQRRRRAKLKTAAAATVTAETPSTEKPKKIRADVTVGRHGHGAQPGQGMRHGADVTAYTAAIALTGAAAWFSIRGMVVLFPGAPASVVAMAGAMEAAKLVTAGWLARYWRGVPWIWRGVLVILVAGLAVINAAGVYAQLVAAHVGERGAAAAVTETQTAALTARIEVAAARVADLDRQIVQIDSVVEAATKRGKTNTALAVIEAQRKARAGLAVERDKAAVTVATLKMERAAVAARGHQAETEAAPILYVAELIGVGSDSERAIRWLIALMVICCDPLAIALTAATAARRTDLL